MNKKLKTLISLLAVIGVLIIGAYLLQQIGDRLPIKQIVLEAGIWGYMVIILGTVIGGIIIPLSHLPFTIASLAIYGFWPTTILFYIGNMVIAPLIDFWLARRFGRPIVLRLAGEKSMRQVDQLVEIAGFKALMILRFFGGVLFDSTSYAMGLTSMRFRHYYLATLLCPIPGGLLTLYILDRGLEANPLYFGIVVVWGYLAGALTFYWLYRKNKNVIKS